MSSSDGDTRTHQAPRSRGSLIPAYEGKNTAPSPESTCDRAISGRSRTFKRELDSSSPPPTDSHSPLAQPACLPVCQAANLAAWQWAANTIHDRVSSFIIIWLLTALLTHVKFCPSKASKEASKHEEQNTLGKIFLSDADDCAMKWLLTTDTTTHQKISSNLISDPHARILVCGKKRARPGFQP